MKSIWAYPTLLALVISLLFSSASYAAPKHFFDGLTGSWKGKGFLTTSIGAKEEAVRCRLQNRKDKAKPKLILGGNCGIGGVLIPMIGWIKQSGKSKKYTASLFKNLGFLRIDLFSGKLKGAKLKLNFKGEDKVNKEDISAFITISSKNKDRFDILISSSDPKTKKVFRVGTIKFSRK